MKYMKYILSYQNPYLELICTEFGLYGLTFQLKEDRGYELFGTEILNVDDIPRVSLSLRLKLNILSGTREVYIYIY